MEELTCCFVGHQGETCVSEGSQVLLAIDAISCDDAIKGAVSESVVPVVFVIPIQFFYHNSPGF